MYFCPIAPTTELDRYAGRSRHQLALAQFARESRAYFKWYRGRVDAGDVVILDSGGYEGHQPDLEEYVRLARELQPHVITVPDVVGDPDETTRLAREFAGMYKGGGGIPMLVVQHYLDSSLFEWARVYKEAVQSFNYVAFPRALRERRVELIAGLHKLGLWDLSVRHHAFGMSAGDVSELPKLNALGVFSCDSSAPVWRGLLGFSFQDSWNDYPFNPRFVLNPSSMWTRKLADENLTEVLNACQSRWAVPSTIKAAPISLVL